jgi:hypothetical protein
MCLSSITLDSMRRERMLMELGGREVYFLMSFREERLLAKEAEDSLE